MKKAIKLLRNKETQEIQDYELHHWQDPNEYEEIDNYVFEDTLVFDHFSGYNSINIEMKSFNDGRMYHLFLSEAEKLFKQKLWDRDMVSGRWTFRKHGKAFSIVYLGKCS